MHRLSLKLTLLLFLLTAVPAPAVPPVQFGYLYHPDSLPRADNDEFGQVVTTGDFDGDDQDDIVVGLPFKDLDGEVAAGAVVILPTSVPAQVLQSSRSGRSKSGPAARTA